MNNRNNVTWKEKLYIVKHSLFSQEFPGFCSPGSVFLWLWCVFLPFQLKPQGLKLQWTPTNHQSTSNPSSQVTHTHSHAKSCADAVLILLSVSNQGSAFELCLFYKPQWFCKLIWFVTALLIQSLVKIGPLVFMWLAELTDLPSNFYSLNAAHLQNQLSSDDEHLNTCLSRSSEMDRPHS